MTQDTTTAARREPLLVLMVVLALLAASALAAVVRGDGSDSPSGPLTQLLLGGAPDGSVLAAGLVTADSCEELGATMQDLRREAEGRYGAAGGLPMATDDAAEESVAADGAGAAVPSTGEAAASGRADATNVQVAGVDEPDLVELVGGLVVSGTAGQVRVLDVVDGSPVLLGSLDVDGWDVGLMAVDETRVVALVRGGEQVRPMTDAGLVPGGWGATRVLLVDLSDPTAPTVAAELAIEGDLVDARMVDGALRLATRSYGPQVEVYDAPALRAIPEPDWETATQDEIRDWEQAHQQAWSEAYDAAWSQVTAEDWLPHAATTADGTTTTAPVVDCDRVGFPTTFSGMGTLTITAVDATDGRLQLQDAAAIVASGETLYATADRLVVATSRWIPVDTPGPAVEPAPVDPVEPFVEVEDAPAVSQVMPMIEPGFPGPWGGESVTDLHVFDVDAGRVAHVASGSVEGRLLNQYAMSIHEGVLRTATTSIGDDGRSQSSVVTHRVEGTELVEVGRVDGLGPNEDIQSVRYLGDVAYVVTFRRTDPLYVVDLADPTAPEVLGELKIEGYSAHLQPVRPGVLLGVGQDADPETGMELGTQVSTFDVTDPTAPRRIDVDVLPNSSSQVQWDPKALLITADALVVTPVEEWDDRYRAGALVHRVTESGTLDRLGRLDVGDLQYALAPRRAVDLDDVILTIGEAGAITWDRETLQPVGRVVVEGRVGEPEVFLEDDVADPQG